MGETCEEIKNQQISRDFHSRESLAFALGYHKKSKMISGGENNKKKLIFSSQTVSPPLAPTKMEFVMVTNNEDDIQHVETDMLPS